MTERVIPPAGETGRVIAVAAVIAAVVTAVVWAGPAEPTGVGAVHHAAIAASP